MHDVVRPGVFLYGVGAGESIRPEPVVSLSARVLELHTVPAGQSVSYGATWVAKRESTVATIGLGYADGLRRSASNVGQVMVGTTPRYRSAAGRVGRKLAVRVLDVIQNDGAVSAISEETYE